jgi:type 1 fimbriae regulatory protein FimB/type 1 fimbriae regulatory protein FimE
MSEDVSVKEKPNVLALPKKRSRRVPPGSGDGKRLYLRPDEANAIITVAGKVGRQGFRDRVMLRLIYRHGLRVSEACGLQWQQLDLNSSTIHVRRAKMGADATHTMDRDELRDLRKLKADASCLYVFESERGGPMDPCSVQRICQRAGEAAGLGFKVHPHMLRHAAGFMLVNSGTDLRLIQAFLGHRAIASTVRYTALDGARLAAVRVR